MLKKDQQLVVSWNKDWVKKQKRAAFVKAHLHLGSEDVLGEEYDKIVKPK